MYFLRLNTQILHYLVRSCQREWFYVNVFKLSLTSKFTKMPIGTHQNIMDSTQWVLLGLFAGSCHNSDQSFRISVNHSKPTSIITSLKCITIAHEPYKFHIAIIRSHSITSHSITKFSTIWYFLHFSSIYSQVKNVVLFV